MKFFKRKKPNNIFELPIDKAALYDACILSTLFHLVGELKDPIFSYEQSWDDNHYHRINDEGRGTITFLDDGFIAAFRFEGSRRLREEFDIENKLKEMPEEYREIAESETLQFLLEDVDGVVQPSITTFIWNINGKTYSFDDLTTFQTESAELIMPHISNEKDLMNYWMEYHEDLDKNELDFVNTLWNFYKKNKSFKGLKLNISDLPNSYQDDGLREFVETLNELGIQHDIKLPEKVKKPHIKSIEKTDISYDYLYLNRYCAYMTILYASKRDLFPHNIKLEWKENCFYISNVTTTIILCFQGRTYIGACLTHHSYTNRKEIPDYIMDSIHSDKCFASIIAKQNYPSMLYFWCNFNVESEVPFNEWEQSDIGLVKWFLGFKDEVKPKLQKKEQDCFENIVEKYIKLDILMSIFQHTVVESIEKRYLKLNKADISDVDFDEQVLSQINIMLVK
ncbi:hypothetical protein DXA09_05155 [Absiella sp. AM54-8XD]|uniref:hypothetical protein n=1 Tax=Absiella sp. AM54-8XD TaxID=2292279 RepID=UPI000E425A39|nr:hypothetical protein [Absiella sp. AM54-8XD]RGC24463.1 hypothetical protein DXA09_05155 [Absiella sp. AM54-8XD]